MKRLKHEEEFAFSFHLSLLRIPRAKNIILNNLKINYKKIPSPSLLLNIGFAKNFGPNHITNHVQHARGVRTRIHRTLYTSTLIKVNRVVPLLSRAAAYNTRCSIRLDIRIRFSLLASTATSALDDAI